MISDIFILLFILSYSNGNHVDSTIANFGRLLIINTVCNSFATAKKQRSIEDFDEDQEGISYKVALGSHCRWVYTKSFCNELKGEIFCAPPIKKKICTNVDKK